MQTFKELQFLKYILSNRSTHSNLSTPQASVDSFDRFEYIEDTTTSKKPDVTCSPMQSGVVPKHRQQKENGLQVPKKERQQVKVNNYQRVHWIAQFPNT